MKYEILCILFHFKFFIDKTQMDWTTGYTCS